MLLECVFAPRWLPMTAEAKPTSLTLRAIAAGVVYAVTVTVMTLLPLAAMTYLYLFADKSNQAIQSAPPQGVPIPRSLEWSDSARHLITDITPFTAPCAWFVEIGLGCILVYSLLRALNPTFRVTTGVDWNQGLLNRTYMHTPPMIKAFLIGITASPVLATAWYVLERCTGKSPIAIAFRMALLGAAGWILLSRDGVAGDYDNGNCLLPHGRRAITSLLVRGALAGILGAALAIAACHSGADPYFRMFRAMGAIGESQWHSIVGLALTPALGFGFAAGGILTALAVPWHSTRQRIAASAVPALVFVITAVQMFVVVPGRAARLHDFHLGKTEQAEQQLKKIVGTPAGAPTVTRFVILATGSVTPTLTYRDQSTTGIRADAATAARITRFLDSRGWQTALASPAISTLHDAASAAWEPERSLDIDRRCMESCPDFEYVTLYAEALMTIAATDAARRNARALADITRYNHPDRDSRALVGDVFARLGNRTEALAWYARAGMPALRAARRLERRAAVCDGSVHGKVTWNGHPLVGGHVAVMPSEYLHMLANAFVGPSEIRPNWLRHIAASGRTASDGSFRLDGLNARAYVLLVALPPHAPDSVIVNSATPLIAPTPKLRAVEMGTIALASPRP